MSAINWTPSQNAAITDNGGTLLLSAAAGSGKTAVLVERAVRLMLDDAHPVPADRILIVTFTRAAAEELRSRIGVRLAAQQALEPLNLNIRRQRLLLGRASIGTIDAFCMQLLKMYFAELSIPPDFDKADDALINALRSASIAETLEKMYTDEAFTELGAMYGRSRSDINIAQAVLQVYDFLRSCALPSKMSVHLAQMWTSPKPLCNTEWGHELLTYASQSLESALNFAHAANTIALDCSLEHYSPAIESDISAADKMLRLVSEKKWDEAFVAINSYKATALRGKKGYEGDEVDTVKLLRDKFKKTIQKLREGVFVCTEAEHDADVQRAAPMICALLNAARVFEEIFYQKKISEKVLEYSDFEHLARKLLASEDGKKTKAAIALSSQFDAIMIDEFQDTNALQALLYDCLANAEGTNIFMVGDVKQSIYRFRLAEPGIFVGKKDSYKEYGTGYPSVITLGHNFRSAESVVDQINYIFSCVMSRELGGVDYQMGERLVAGGGAGQLGEAAEINILDTNGRRCEAADAEHIADKISSMMKSSFQVREGTATRPCRYGDFCILLRTRSSFIQYAAALETRGIPCVADTSSNSLMSPEISPLLSLLRVIDNPGKDIHMAAVLLSPMYSLLPQELLSLRKKEQSLYSSLSMSDIAKYTDICAELRYFRAVCASATFDELISTIMERTSFFAAVSAMPEGNIRRENLRAFIGYAANKCASFGGLSSFLRRIDSSEGIIAEINNAVKSSHGAVNIMTVHKSKGLEFPVCILANAQHSFNLSDSSSSITLSPRLGIGLALRAEQGSLYSTLPLRALSIAERRDSVSEEMRVLYVALTRARDKLIITMAQKDIISFLQGISLSLMCGTAAQKSLLLGATDMATWICAAALLHPDCSELRRIKMGALLPIYHNEKSKFIVSSTYFTDAVEVEEQLVSVPAELDLTLLTDISNNFILAEELARRKHLPVKLSVSALTKKNSRDTLSRPSFLYAEGLTAAEKGTAMHNVLQFINFKDALMDLPTEIARLCSEGFVLEQIMRKLDLDALSHFLKSGIIGRVLSAKTFYREYDFLTDYEEKENINGTILVQGIADLVLIGDNGIEIVDYKTDRGKTSQQLIAQYKNQLHLYAGAISRRLDEEVTRLSIYSFALSKEIDVPLQ